MTDGNDANARPDSAAAAAPDEWSPVNLNKSVSPPDHGFSPPPGYPDPGPGFTAAQPGFTGPQTGQTAPPPDYSAAARGYATPGYPSATPDPYSAAYGYAAYPVRGSGTDGLAVAVFGLALLPAVLNSRMATRKQTPEATLARDFAHALLQSVPPGGILFTWGDNDTFPLWYARRLSPYRHRAPGLCRGRFARDKDWPAAKTLPRPCRDCSAVA